MKTCTKCGLIKNLSEYYFRKDANKYRPECKECWKQFTHHFKYNVVPWRKHYYAARRRSTVETDKSYHRYKIFEFNLTMEETEILWNRDKAWLLKKPSINRINPLKGYKFDNCEFIEMKINTSLANQDSKRKPVLQFDLDGSFIKEWDSAKTAGKILNIDSGDIGRVCMGKQSHAHFYYWSYKNE